MAALSLVFDLLGRDVSASKAFNDVGDSAERAGKKGEGFGSSISTGLKLATGALLGAGLIEGFKGFYSAAAESAKVAALTQAAITSTGGAANVTADQVSKLATAISNKTGVDDEAIQSGANLLLTFTNVKNVAGKGNDIFNQTTSIMTDMAAVLGTDASGSAIQLGKALNDPVKGVAALTKVGVSFTQQQKDQIKTLVASGDTLGAQKVILAELSKEFGGAAEAASTPLDKLKVNLGNLQEQIGGYLIPIVSKFSDFAVGTLLPGLQNLGGYLGDTLGPVFGRVKDAVSGLYDLIVNGDFTGALVSAFNIQEDNPVVGWVLDARDAVLHAWDNLGSIWANLDISGLGDKIKDAAIEAGGSLLTGIKTGLDSGDWAPLGASIASIVGDALGHIADLAGMLYKSFADLMGKVDWVGVGLEIGKQVPTLLAGLALGILNFDLGGLLAGLGDHWFDVLMGILALAFLPAKWVGKIGELLGKIPLAGKFLEWGLNGIKGLTDNIVGWVGDVIGGFVRGFLGEGTKIGGAFRDIFETVKTQLFVWGDDVIGWFRSLPGRFVGAAEDLGGALRAKFDEIATYMGDAIRRGAGAAVDWVSGLPGRILGALGDMGSLLLSAGGDLIRGFINGIKNMAGGVASAALDVAKSAVSSVKSFLGIHSPSTVFAGLGANVGQGFVNGIVGMQPAVASAMAAMANSSALTGLTGGGIGSVSRISSAAVSGAGGYSGTAGGAGFDYDRMGAAVARAMPASVDMRGSTFGSESAAQDVSQQVKYALTLRG